MTNTEVLQFIIEKLENSSHVTWSGDKELFELIFKPIPYGNETEKRQKEAKQPILDIFQNVDKFDKTKFDKLAKNIISGRDEECCREKIIAFLQEEITRLEIKTDEDIKELIELIPCKGTKDDLGFPEDDKGARESIYNIFQNVDKFNKIKFTQLAKKIICGENEKRDRKTVIAFLQEEITRLKVTTDVDIEKLVEIIPCKNSGEKNYKTCFSNWRQNKHRELIAVEGASIQDPNIKKALQKNFNFESSLWSKGNTFIKQKLQEGIDSFIEGFIYGQNPDIDIIDPPLTDEELDDLLKIRGMNIQEIKQYLQNHSILSQKFVEELIYILYKEGYYELLLYEVFDKFYKDDVGIKKIKAHVLGSDEIGKYLEACLLLNTIPSDDDDEIINMRTSLYSNMRRLQLNNTKTNNNQKKEIIEVLISNYKKAFEDKNNYNYYPGIHLAYMSVIAKTLFGDGIKLDDSISSIYNKSKKSINKDKSGNNTADKYYANITDIEFMLLMDMGSSIAKLNQFLNSEDQTIPIIGLEQTRRQMQFFIDILASFEITNNHIISNMQESIKIIDGFIDHLSGFKM